MKRVSGYLQDEAATEALGARLAAIRPDDGVVHLVGDLGAGKTTLVRGFLRAAGHAGSVKSPTYTLVEPYMLAGRKLFHLDLYRLTDPEELEFIGLREMLTGALLLIEWPDQGRGVLPEPDLIVTLTSEGQGRRAALAASDPRWQMGVDQIFRTKP